MNTVEIAQALEVTMRLGNTYLCGRNSTQLEVQTSTALVLKDTKLLREIQDAYTSKLGIIIGEGEAVKMMTHQILSIFQGAGNKNIVIH